MTKSKKDAIEIAGASENNLQNIDVTIQKEQLTVFVGISGPEKSSLAFDTIAVKVQIVAGFLPPLYPKQNAPLRTPCRRTNQQPHTPIVVNQKTHRWHARSTVGTIIDVAPLIRLLFSRIGKPGAGSAMAYSFNHPPGMCPDCTGLGETFRTGRKRAFRLHKIHTRRSHPLQPVLKRMAKLVIHHQSPPQPG